MVLRVDTSGPSTLSPPPLQSAYQLAPCISMGSQLWPTPVKTEFLADLQICLSPKVHTHLAFWVSSYDPHMGDPVKTLSLYMESSLPPKAKKPLCWGVCNTWLQICLFLKCIPACNGLLGVPVSLWTQWVSPTWNLHATYPQKAKKPLLQHMLSLAKP